MRDAIEAGTILIERAAPKAGWTFCYLAGEKRQRGEITEQSLFAEEAVAAWEDEGGAPGHTGGRLAA